MSHYRIFLFGYPRIEIDKEPIALSRRKGLALLAYLAVSGKKQSREALAALFWPDYAPAAALAHLRRTLYALRMGLADFGLAVDRFQVSLTTEQADACDVVQFRSLLLVPEGHTHSSESVCPDCTARQYEALALYRNDFLAGFSLPDCPEFDLWQSLNGDILRQEWASAMEQVALAETRLGDPASAIERWKGVLGVNPLYEEGIRQVMALYVANGQRSLALRRYQDYVADLYEELAALPSRQMIRFFEGIQTGHSPAAPPENGHPTGPVIPVSAPPLPDPPPFSGEATGPAAISALGLLQRQKQRHFFCIIDQDGDGKIQWSDFQRYLDRAAAIGPVSVESSIYRQALVDIQNWWAGIKSAGDRAQNNVGELSVTLDGWLAFWSEVMQTTAQQTIGSERAAIQSLDDSVRIHFQLFDGDRDGLLSAQEYAKWMTAWGGEMDALSNFRRLDRDRDGYLTLDEIRGYLRQFHFSNDPDAVGNYLYGNPWSKER